MQSEIEIRLLECNEDDIIRKLEICGAEFVGDWVQKRYCYDFDPVKENSWIRLRTNGKETTLTIKEIQSAEIDGTKELEIVVSDFETTNEILRKLGYQVRSVQENRRIRYMFDGVEVDIDMWPMIPSYVEFEGKSEESIKDVCKKLGVDFSKLTTMDVMSIYKHYGFGSKALESLKLEEERKIKKFNSSVGFTENF
ncbi:MAG: CYTH domain-containing protein [Clostridia bacterium]|nr:CYTH domain-containing protein [Clostridia bacterium]